MDETQTQQLQAHIQQQLQTGMTPDEISQQLQAAGWPIDLIHQGFQAVQASVLPTSLQTELPAESSQSAQPVVPLPMANGKRRGRIKTGWLLLKQSVAVLRSNPYLLRFLLMTYLWIMATTVLFFVIYWVGYNSFYKPQPGDYSQDAGITPLGYLMALIDYVVTYFIINYYAAALAGNMLDIFDGKKLAFRDYTKMARSKTPAILMFSIIEATVGLILRFIVERIRFVGWLLAWLLGTVWSLGTMFVLPIIITSDTSAPSAIKQSIGFFKATWGENITAKVTVNGPLFLINLAVICCFNALLWPAFFSGSYILVLLVIFIFLFIFITIAILGSFANSLINVSLFYYAKYQRVPSSFSVELLNQVFVPHKKRGLFKKNST